MEDMKEFVAAMQRLAKQMDDILNNEEPQEATAGLAYHVKESIENALFDNGRLEAVFEDWEPSN